MDHVDRVLAQWAEVRPDLDTGPMGTLGRLSRLYGLLAAGLEEVHAREGLNAASFDVLATLYRAGPPHALTPSQLADWTMVTSGTMTNRIDRLAARGFVTREPNPDDGRGFLVVLTTAGRAMMHRLVEEHVANQHRLVSGLTPREREQFDRLLRKWLAGLGDASGVDP